MFERSLGPLALLTVLGVAGRLVLVGEPDPRTWVGAGFALLFVVAASLLRSGRRALAVRLTTLVGAGTLLCTVATTGGAGSTTAAYLPMGAIALWTWVGSRSAIVYSGLATAAIALPAAPLGDPGPASRLELWSAYACAISVAAGLTATSVADLRRAVELSWARATQAERAAAAAQRADEARTRFLSLVSRELRPPLDAVLDHTLALRTRTPDEERGTDLDRIAAAGRQLRRLIDDLLDMSQIQIVEDDLTIARERLALGPRVREVTEMVAPLVDPARCQLVVDLSEDVPEILGDDLRVRQILTNLLTNAIKYTEHGTIRVEVQQADNAVHVRVVDTGIGIAADKMPRLFEPFVQLHDGTRRRPGVGLGLALSQCLAERMGGVIEAESTVGEGSTFTLRLPIAEAQAA